MKNLLTALLPALALFALGGCAGTSALTSSEDDGVYYSSKDRTTAVVSPAPAPAGTDEATNPDYNGNQTRSSARQGSGSNEYYDNTYTYMRGVPSYGVTTYVPYSPYTVISYNSYGSYGWGGGACGYSPYAYGGYDPFYSPFYSPYYGYGPSINISFGFGQPYGYGGYGYGRPYGYGYGYGGGFYDPYYYNSPYYGGYYGRGGYYGNNYYGGSYYGGRYGNGYSNNGYYGNEVYGFDLRTLAWVRLTEPNPVIGECPSPDAGVTCATHTYDGLEYLPLPYDRFMAVGWDGWSQNTLNLATNTWEAYPDKPQQGARTGANCAYDVATRSLWYHAGSGALSTWSPNTGRWAMRSDVDNVGYYRNGFVDPKRKRYIALGNGGVETWSIDALGKFVPLYARLATSGDTDIEAVGNPGAERGTNLPKASIDQVSTPPLPRAM